MSAYSQKRTFAHSCASIRVVRLNCESFRIPARSASRGCLLRAGLIANHRGHVFSSAGDRVFAEFASPVEVVRCAIEIQGNLEMRDADLPEDRRMRLSGKSRIREASGVSLLKNLIQLC